MASTITLQSIVKSAQARPELHPVLGTSGWEQEPALTIANDTMQKFLAQNFDWKFNRARIQPFLTIALQQDYIGVQPLGGSGGLLNVGWFERGNRVDINNTSDPLPNFPMETVRDLPKTSWQADPFNISFVPVPLAFYGTWQEFTSYPTGLGASPTPASPIQQFVDIYGNYLYVSGNGTSGSTKPNAGHANATPGTTITDGSVTWTVADPNAVAVRVSPIPPTSGITWSIEIDYQMKPPILTSLQNIITPIPDEYGYLFRQGFNALCRPAGSTAQNSDYVKWQEDLVIALRGADREREDCGMYPSYGLTTGSGPAPVSAANPYGYSSGW